MKLQKAEFVYKMVQGGYNYEDIARVIKIKKLNTIKLYLKYNFVKKH